MMDSILVKDEEAAVSFGGVATTATSSSSSSSYVLVPKPLEVLQDMGTPPFLTKIFEMVEDPSTDSVVSWSGARNSFIVWDYNKFSVNLLPKYFKHSNFSSFIRQLNTYGFRKVDPNKWEFANEGFLGGQKHLLKTIKRRRHVCKNIQHERNNCIEIGQYGLEDEIHTLKRDKNTLMMEIVKLRQLQQNSLQELMLMGERLKGTEKKQHLMMALLAKALRTPTFAEKLILKHEQKKELAGFSDGVSSGVSSPKKRRLPCCLSTENFEKDLLRAETEIATFLSSVTDNRTSAPTQDTFLSSVADNRASAPTQDGKTPGSMNSLCDSEPGDIMWAELLNNELLVRDEEKEVDEVQVEDLVAGEEDVLDLVEQMGYLGSKQCV